MGALIQKKIDEVRAYVNEQDKQNSDFYQILPYTVFDAVLANASPGASTLTETLSSITALLTALAGEKQPLLPAGTANTIMSFTGTPGVVASLAKTDAINSTAASSDVLVTEKAIEKYHTDVIVPELQEIHTVVDTITALQTAVGEIELNINNLSSSVDEVSNRVTAAEGQVTAIQGTLTEYDARISAKITSNPDIVPGTFPKVTYDEKGLITSGTNLVAADIPVDVMTRISDLETAVPEKASISDLDALSTTVATKLSSNTLITGATKTKITYDEKGLVLSGEDLTADDIPVIPITTVDGLSAALDTKAATADLADLVAVVDEKASASSVTDLTDTVSAMNTTVLQLGETVAEDHSKIETMGGCIEDVETEVTTANTNITNLTTSLTSIEGAVTGLAESLYGEDTENGLGPYLVSRIEGGTNINITRKPGSPNDILVVSYTGDTGDIEISDVVGLQAILDEKVIANTTITAGTGTKVTYDAKGLVTGSDVLEAADIPNITLSQVTGLETTITNLQAAIDGKINANTAITAGTHTKVTYDESGLVTSGENLTAADIPNIAITQVTGLAQALEDIGTVEAIEALREEVNQKLTGNTPIVAGTATKITYDEKGLIVSGEDLTIDDLPEFSVDDIDGLSTALDTKATGAGLSLMIEGGNLVVVYDDGLTP